MNLLNLIIALRELEECPLLLSEKEVESEKFRQGTGRTEIIVVQAK